MTDDERIARLTELARRIWAEHGPVRIEVDAAWQAVSVCYGDDGFVALVEGHPRALDALEAALTVLAGEPPQPHWVDELWGHWTAWAMQREAMAHEVKSTHTDLHLNIASTLRSCAAELRERAKEG